MRAQIGVTLIELVLVLILAGILAAAALDRLPGASLTLGGQADALTAEVHLVQTLEMTHGASYCLRLLPAAYEIETQQCTVPVANPANGQTVTLLGPGMTLNSNLPNGYLAFYGPGVPYAAPGTALMAPAVITLTAAGQTRTIQVAPQTGHGVSP